MIVLYLTTGLFIIAMNVGQLPHALSLDSRPRGHDGLRRRP